jgi:hypothetical protein
MNVEGVAIIPTCPEYGARWLPADEAGGRHGSPTTSPPELVFYCADCAEREFGQH